MDKFYKIGYNTSMLNILVAPLSECEKGENNCKRIVAQLKQDKVEYSVYFSPDINEIEKNAQELTKEGETDFVIVGNDVVLHTFLNSVKDVSKIRVGIVPTGDADFAHFLGLNTNPVEAIKDIIAGNCEAVDYLTVNNIKVINNILIGASAELYELYSQQKLKNALTRKMLRARYGNSFSGANITLISKNADGKAEPVEEKIFELCIANGGNSKGKTISPLSNVSDGLFNLTYINIEETEERKKQLTQFEKGESIYNERTHQKWLSNIKIVPVTGQIKAMVDGQILKFDSMNVSVVENGLKLFKAKL